MKKSDAHESNRKRRSREDIRRRVRTYRIIGVLAGLMTTASIAAAGYLAINYWETIQMATEPSLPQQLATIELPSASAPVNASVPSVTDPVETTAPSQSAAQQSTEDMTNTTTKAEESTTQRETETETGTLSEDEKEDRELRMKALEKFENLGIVVGVNNYLNMRTEPTTQADICGKIFYACGVNVLEDAGNGWYKVESGGVTGYVAQQYIATGENAVELALKHCRYQAKVMVDTLNVLRKPEEDADVITFVREGELYDVLSFKGDWAEIEAVEDLSGYVHVSDIDAGYHLEEAIVFGYDDTISQTRIDIINKAFEYYGNPYVWAGRDLENGVDCSAYTYLIYEMFGIDLEIPYSITQSTLGKKVAEEDIRPGDLIFYVGRFDGQIGHVAIYIGNNKIIHAASESKGICVSDWKYVPIVTIRDVIGDR